MESPSTGVWATFAAVLIATGVTILIATGRLLLVIFGVFLVALGFLVFVVLLVPPLHQEVARRADQYRRHRERRRMHAARYRQRLRCPNGHEWEEEVRHVDPGGWLPVTGEQRRCPKCQAQDGFQSLGAVPLNRQAEKGKYIPPPEG